MDEVIAEMDLCHKGGNEGLTADYYRAEDAGLPRPNTGAGVQLGIGYYFTCADQADGQHFWPCTGSKHLSATEVVRCNCACHSVAGGLINFAAPDVGEGK